VPALPVASSRPHLDNARRHRRRPGGDDAPAPPRKRHLRHRPEHGPGLPWAGHSADCRAASWAGGPTLHPLEEPGRV